MRKASPGPPGGVLPWPSRLWVFACAVLPAVLALGSLAPAFAQNVGPLSEAVRGDEPAPEAPAAPPSLEEQITRAKERLEELKGKLARAEEGGEWVAPPSAKPEEIEERRRLLGDLVRNLTSRVSSLERLQETASRQDQLAEEAEDWQGFSEKPPYPIAFADALREEILSVKLALDSIEAEKDRDKASLGLWEDRLKEAEPEVRRLTEQLERETDPIQVNRLQWLLELARLRSRSASVGLGAVKTSLDDLNARAKYRKTQLAFLQRKLEAARAQLSFTKAELDERLEGVLRARVEIQADLEAAAARQERIDGELAKLREELEQLKKARDEGSTGPDVNARIERLEKTIETREVEFATASLMVEAYKTYLTGSNAKERIWKDRYALSKISDPQKMTEVHRRNELGFKQLALWEKFFISRLQLALTDFVNQKQRLADWTPADGDRAEAEAVLGFYEERLQALRQGLAQVNEVRTLLSLWQSEVDERRKSVPIGERITSYLATLANTAKSIWDFELFTLEDTIVVDGEEMKGQRPVTVAKILLALIVLGLGIWASRLIARGVHMVATSRFKAEENVAALIDKALYIVLLVSVVLIAISFVQIPLTAFAFAGGALAIGAGFGAQNLINNFISGIILLLERPIKLGDIVDVEGIRGRVVNIGGRSSTVKRFDGIDILIPNSSFLEKNVTNWTRSDPFLRFTVTVGVAYGSPTRRVQEILEHLVQNDPKVLKYPEPRVIFEDFGDSALIFTVFFWMAIQAEADYRVLASEMRHQIDDLFRKEGITIAFPQRDVHLDNLSPVQVELVDGAGARRADGGAKAAKAAKTDAPAAGTGAEKRGGGDTPQDGSPGEGAGGDG